MKRLPVLWNFVTDRIHRLPVAFIQVTERCNSKCLGCDYWKHGERELSVNRARTLSQELDALGTTLAVLSGGEPLFHPRWREVAASLRTPERSLWLLTSGVSLTREADRNDVADLFERVTVSLDGATRASYLETRGVDAFEIVVAGIEALIARGRWVSVRTTVQRKNFRELPELVRLAESLGVAEISFLPADVTSRSAFARNGNTDTTGLALSKNELDELRSVLDEVEVTFPDAIERGFLAEDGAKLRKIHAHFAAVAGLGPFPETRCNAPRFSAVIGPDGAAQPCFFIQGESGASLEEALDRTASVRAAIRRGARKECTRCVCPMWKHPVHFLKGAGAGAVV